MLKKFRKSSKGVIAIEFAILLPLFLFMFFGSFEIGRYILVSKKADNAAADIAALVAREGSLVNQTNCLSRANSDLDANALNNIIGNSVPALMHPYQSTDYSAFARFVGWPQAAPLFPNTLRLMWTHKYCGGGATSAASNCTTGTANITIPASVSAISCLNATGSGNSCTYSEDGKIKAKMVMQGQGYVIVDFAYPYKMVIDGFSITPTGGGTAWTLPILGGTIKKSSSYVVRGRECTPRTDPPTYTSKMNLCWNCNGFNSGAVTPTASGCGTTANSVQSSACLRARCQAGGGIPSSCSF